MLSKRCLHKKQNTVIRAARAYTGMGEKPSGELGRWWQWANDGLIAIFDTETTGVSPDRDVVVQFGAIDLNEEVIIHSLVQLNVPIPPGATRVHGITNADLKDAPNWGDVYRRFRQYRQWAALLGYNIAFDASIVQHSHKVFNLGVKQGIYPPPAITLTKKIATACVMKMYAVMAGKWNPKYQSFKWVKLSVAAAASGIKVKNAHDSVADCRMTVRLLKWIANQPIHKDVGPEGCNSYG